MYSRKRGSADAARTVPPFYSGVRFQGGSGEIGNEGILPRKEPEREKQGENDVKPVSTGEVSREAPGGFLKKLLDGVGSDELLIIALILLLSGEDGDNREAIVMLVLLLISH